MEPMPQGSDMVEEQVKDIAKLLSRAAKNYQMYLSNNRMFITSLENLKEALAAFLEDNEILTFVVREFELLHRNVPVYSNPDKYQSIAFRMYRDGVRLISFHRGISENDLLAFFEALTRCMETDNLEEDFVTLLWERDLQAITYYEVNDFESSYEDLRKKGTRGGAAPGQISGSALAQAPWNRITSKGEQLRPIITLTPEDLQEVRDLTLAVDDELFLRRAGQVLNLTIEHDDTEEAHLDMETAFIGYLDTCVSKMQIGLACQTLKQIRQRYGRYEDPQVAEALSRIICACHAEKNMAAIGEVLAGGKETAQDQCQEYLSQLGPEAIPAVLKLLPHCAGHTSRNAVVKSLAAIAGGAPVNLVKSADCDSPEEIEAVLDILDLIGDESSLEEAMKFRNHSAARVRAKVATLAAKLETRLAQEVAESLIRDPDHAVRRRALASLVEIGGEQSVKTLIDLFTSKEFHLLSHDSKLSMLLVIRNLSPGDQDQVMDSIFRMRSFFRKKPLEDTKSALLEIIHLMDAETAGQSLRKLVKQSSGRLSRAASSALKKVSHD